MKVNSFLVSLVPAVVAVALTGCGSTAKYVDARGPRTVVTLNQVNIQDFSQAAEDAVNSLLASGHLGKVSNPPAILAVSRVINSTGQQIDTDLLTKKIRVALNQSGSAVTTTTYGLGGKGEDELAQQILRDANNNQPATLVPDFSLSGKIVETRSRAGNTRQAAYTFQLTLTDRRGLAVWESEKEIVKQGTRPSVGF